MKDQKTYLKEVIEVLSKVDDLWVLGVIYRFICNMTMEDGM